MTSLPPHAERHAPALPLWGIRLLALAAAGISAYLLYGTLAATRGPLGCGPLSDCERVLDSRWSTWVGIPVSAPAAVLYLLIVGASFVAGSGSTPKTRRSGWLALLALSLMAAGAAGWFVYLQIDRVGRTCPYCMAVHACGLVIAVLACIGFVHAARLHGGAGSPAPIGLWQPILGAGLAAAAVAGLAAGQLLWEPPKPAPRIYQAKVGERLVDVDQTDLPLVGWAKAPRSVVVMNDYTCPHCRDLHRQLATARERYAQQFSVTVMTVPFGVRCNPTLARQLPMHRYACELATLALAVWRAKPEAYARMDDYLYAWPAPPGGGDPVPPEPKAARAFAASLVGEAALARAMENPWIARRLRENIDLYQSISKSTHDGSIPKMIFREHTVTLRADNEAQLFKVLETELGLAPPSGG